MCVDKCGKRWACLHILFAPGSFSDSESLANPDEYGIGAGDETRTRDIFLGKEVLYQLSYTRVSAGRKLEGRFRRRKQFFPANPEAQTRAARRAAMPSNSVFSASVQSCACAFAMPSTPRSAPSWSIGTATEPSIPVVFAVGRAWPEVSV